MEILARIGVMALAAVVTALWRASCPGSDESGFAEWTWSCIGIGLAGLLFFAMDCIRGGI